MTSDASRRLVASKLYTCDSYQLLICYLLLVLNALHKQLVLAANVCLQQSSIRMGSVAARNKVQQSESINVVALYTSETA
jgi:hypothetical protein